MTAYSGSGGGVGGGGGWQDLIALRLNERDVREKAHDDIIANYQKLASHARALQARNQSMIQAAGLGTSSPAPAVSLANQRAAVPANNSGTTGGVETSSSAESNAIRQSYISSLESQLAATRDELASAYKTQSQNAQRLLLLNEQMREKDEAGKGEAIELRGLRDERERMLRRERDLRDAAGEKDKVIEMLQDELRTLSLELNQVEARNDDLKRDNASLLQRWLDRARDEADKVNEANRYIEEVEKRRKGQHKDEEAS